MSEPKPLTAYGLAFVAIRLFAIYVGYHFCMDMGRLLYVLKPTYNDQIYALIEIIPLLLLQLVLIIAGWFAAPFCARLISRPASRDDMQGEPASVRDWQNMVLTLLGFYILYRLGMDTINLFQTYDTDPTLRNIVRAVIGVRLFAGLLLIFAPGLITDGLERVRGGLSKFRGIGPGH